MAKLQRVLFKSKADVHPGYAAEGREQREGPRAASYCVRLSSVCPRGRGSCYEAGDGWLPDLIERLELCKPLFLSLALSHDASGFNHMPAQPYTVLRR